MKLQRIIRDYFTFTRNERIGLIILLLLVLLTLLANQLVFYFEKPGKVDQEKFRQLLAMLEEKQADEKIRFRGTLFYFDPNSIDSIGLDSLLLPIYVKKNLLAYRSKGGRFYADGDFRKIYGMNDSIFDAIRPYLQIEEQKQGGYTSGIARKEPAGSLQRPRKEAAAEVIIRPIEINTATGDELEVLYGIGEVFSSRIVKYRQLLGGFSTLEQLHEVYGLKPETIENILPYLKLDTAQVEQINVNFAQPGELAKHPYISWDMANAIVDFRSGNGFMNDLQTIRLNKLMNAADFKRISPYLKTKN
jgi:competence ComEA-like helix-hairpin-helix protein